MNKHSVLAILVLIIALCYQSYNAYQLQKITQQMSELNTITLNKYEQCVKDKLEVEKKLRECEQSSKSQSQTLSIADSITSTSSLGFTTSSITGFQLKVKPDGIEGKLTNKDKTDLSSQKRIDTKKK